MLEMGGLIGARTGGVQLSTSARRANEAGGLIVRLLLGFTNWLTFVQTACSRWSGELN